MNYILFTLISNCFINRRQRDRAAEAKDRYVSKAFQLCLLPILLVKMTQRFKSFFRDPSDKTNCGTSIKSGGKGLNDSSNSGNDSDDDSNEATSLRTSSGSDHLIHSMGNHQTNPSHQTLNSVSVVSQSAATATQSALYHGFRLNHHHIGAAAHPHHSHHLADVAPSALVMHSGGTSAETMLQLSAVAAASGLDYGSAIGGTHSQL